MSAWRSCSRMLCAISCASTKASASSVGRWRSMKASEMTSVPSGMAMAFTSGRRTTSSCQGRVALRAVCVCASTTSRPNTRARRSQWARQPSRSAWWARSIRVSVWALVARSTSSADQPRPTGSYASCTPCAAMAASSTPAPTAHRKNLTMATHPLKHQGTRIAGAPQATAGPKGCEKWPVCAGQWRAGRARRPRWVSAGQAARRASARG